MNKRLRIFDLNTPWFWLTAFYERTAFGKPWLSISLWNPHTWQRWWVHVWQWEPVPDERGGYGTPRNTIGDPADMPKAGAGLREGE